MGIVDSAAARRVAQQLHLGGVDFLEWRADQIPLLRPPKVDFPWILTVRDPREGGAGPVSVPERRALFLKHLPIAAAVDIEVRSLATFRDVADRARKEEVTVIASFHDFRKTPLPDQLGTVVKRAVEAGADVLKIAAFTRTPADVATLLALFATSPLPLAVMGMGPLGMASRILFASSGSVLNYGWLHKPNVPGQWSAADLRAIVEKVRAAS